MSWLTLLLCAAMACSGPAEPGEARYGRITMVQITVCPDDAGSPAACVVAVADTVWTYTPYLAHVEFTGPGYVIGALYWPRAGQVSCPYYNADRGECFQFAVWGPYVDGGDKDFGFALGFPIPHRLEIVLVTEAIGGHIIDRYVREFPVVRDRLERD